MKTLKTMIAISASIFALGSCTEQAGVENTERDWVVDRFDDIKVLRYEVPEFDSLTMDEKMLVYYLSRAALSGRDIMFDQNCRYNLPVRRTLEAIYEHSPADHSSEEWLAFEKYLKKVWFANGVHHHYSGDKFVPDFTAEYFDELVSSTPDERFPDDYGDHDDLIATVKKVIFDAGFVPVRINQQAGVDMLATSAMNYYEGVTQREAERFYAAMADPKDNTPISYGLNSKLVKDENGQITEQVWKIGGMYSPAIEKIVYWLEKAQQHANPVQKATLEKLLSFYATGDLREYDEFNILWVQDTLSRVDFVCCFTETYGDPLGLKASWESMINFKNPLATRRTEVISSNAQWFEDNSPVDARFKKKEVKGVSAKVITAAMLGGDCYPATPIGINLPNADWIRRDYGSKSVTIENITDAYEEAAKGNGFLEEFMLREEDRDRIRKYGSVADNLHTDLHECLGHGSGQLLPGVKGDELKNYGSALEETRADLFALYYIADPKMMELGIVASPDVAKAEYSRYIMNGMMTQLTRIQPGKNVEQAHMRNRKLISEWCYEKGKADNVIEKVVENGKTYIVVNDFDKLRGLFATLLAEVQRIKSTGDFEAGRKLVETYGVVVDPALHAEVLARNAELKIEPYSGFINPIYNPVMENGNIVDIQIEYPDSYVDQMLEYSRHWSYLPTRN